MTDCNTCHQPVVNSACGCPTPSMTKERTVCHYPTELGLDPNATYSLTFKKVIGGKACCTATSCGGVTIPLTNGIEDVIFGLFAPYVTVNEVEHGFEIIDHPLPVYQDQANPGKWLLALDAVNQAEGIIFNIIDENNFKVGVSPGLYKLSHGLDPANKYYLSTTVAGGVQTTASTQLLFNPLTTNQLQFFLNT